MEVGDIVRVIGPGTWKTHSYNGTYWNPCMGKYVSKIYMVSDIQRERSVLSPCALTENPDDGIGYWVFAEEWLEKFDICYGADEIDAFLSEFS